MVDPAGAARSFCTEQVKLDCTVSWTYGAGSHKVRPHNLAFRNQCDIFPLLYNLSLFLADMHPDSFYQQGDWQTPFLADGALNC